MKDKKQINTRNLYLFTIIVLLLSVFSGLTFIELKSEEPRRALIALEMIINKNLIVPTLYGESYYNKPPLFNWILLIFYKVLSNNNEFVTRLPGFISYILTGILVFRYTKRFINTNTAILSSIIFFTFSELFFYGTTRFGEIDVFLTLLTFIQCYGIFYFFERKQYLLLFIISYFLTALGVLTKGPPSLVFQALTLFIYFVYKRKFLLLLSWKHFAGIFILFITTGSYFYFYSKQDLVYSYLINLVKEASKFSSIENTMNDNLKIMARFPLLLLQTLLPWYLLFLILLKKKIRKEVRQNNFWIFCLLLFCSNIVVYWTSPGFRTRFIYPFYPFLAIILGYLLHMSHKNYPVQSNKIIKIINTVLLFLLIIAFLTGLFIPDIRSLENYILFSLITVFVFSSLLYINQKNVQFISRFLFLALIIAVVKFNHSFIYLKWYQKDIVSHKKYALDLLQITDNQPIHFTGKMIPFYFNRIKPDNGSFIDSCLEKIYYPPELPFQIPFYITRHTGEIMRFDSVINDSQYYLGYINHIDTSEIDILHYYDTIGMENKPEILNIDINKPYRFKKGLILFKKRN